MTLRAGLVIVLVFALGVAAGVGGAALFDDDDDDAAEPASPASAQHAPSAATRNRVAEQRVKDALARSDQSVPEADTTPQGLRTEGPVRPATMEDFLTAVFGSVRRYWDRTLPAKGLPEVSASFNWVPAGARVQTSCTVPGKDTLIVADDNSAFYCPNDDTIYVAQKLAVDVWNGVKHDFPGEKAGFGRAIGDFGVAYIVAHEYGHAVQQDVGYRKLINPDTSEPFELQADCMSGLWGNSVFQEGRLDPDDVEDALSTTLSLGDFDLFYVDHHGTPAQRQEAWSTGFRSGDPDVCIRYLSEGG